MGDLIRRILIRTVLPIRKRREKFLSQMRFSIAFRITVNYIKLLFLYGVLFLLLVAGLYIFEANKEYEVVAKKYEQELRDTNLLPETINKYKEQGYEVLIIDQSGEEKTRSNFSYRIDSEKFILGKVHFSTQKSEHVLVMRYHSKIRVADKKYKVVIQYDMTSVYNNMLSLLWKLSILFLVLVYIISRRGKKENIKLLEPINKMSEIANRLNVNNLSSERINLAGTQNELKDLASLINKMLDRIETSYESQKQFVSDASHELRTPIAVIQGYGNLLHRWGMKDEEVLKESVDAINNEAKSMQDLVEKLLYLSRHDKKTLKLNKKRFNMGPVIASMIKETALVATNREIKYNVVDDVYVYGDEQALKQALRIFIDNAIKYSEDGDSITISCKNHDGECVISVEDTGIGMQKKDLDHIFQRFYRSDDVRNKNISGHGLGLSLAKIIILAHVGKIKIRTQYTVGTCFTITLPRT